MSGYIIVGKIRKPFGLDGFTFVEPLTFSVDRFFELQNCFVGDNENHLVPVTVQKVEIKGKKLIIKFEGKNSRTDIEKFTNHYIFIDEALSIKLPKGKYFFHQLIGLSVFDKEGNSLGVVKNILELPAHSVLVIDYFGKEVLVPNIKEFIHIVNISKKELVLNVIDGLFE